MTEFIDNDIQTYDSENNRVICIDELNELIKNPYTRSHTVVFRNSLNKKLQGSCIEEAYENYITMADSLKEHLGGKFNFYKCGSVKKMALYEFFNSTKAVQPEEIKATEAQWINDSSHGALMYWEAYKGEVHEYDVNSRYPHVMQRNQHYFPIREGEYKTIDEIDPSNVENGLYKCSITKHDDKPYKLFRFNPKNSYTHLDIKVAIKYGLKIEMIMNGQPNILFYSKDKLMNGAYLFKNFVDELYELKQQKVNGAKDILNTLWGALSETNHFNHSIETDVETHIDDANITRINCDDTIKIRCTYYNKKEFKTNWGRIKPFVLSYARCQMFWSFQQFEKYIVYMHTDGFLLKDGSHDLKLSDALGGLKLEGVFNVNIIGFNKKNKTKK